MNKKILAVILLVLLVLLALGGWALYKNDFFANFGKTRTLTVSGYAFIQQGNRVANFSVFVAAKDANREKAVSLATNKVQAIVEEVKKFGIAEKDIKTHSMNVYRESLPYWEDNVQKFKEGDWTANVLVDITLREVSRVEELASILAYLDISNMWGPTFSVDTQTQEEVKMELMNKAFDNAKERAERLAANMGLKLGRVLNVVEGYGIGVNYGYFYLMRYDHGGVGASGSGDYLQPGSSELSTTLTVTFELKE